MQVEEIALRAKAQFSIINIIQAISKQECSDGAVINLCRWLYMWVDGWRGKKKHEKERKIRHDKNI